MSNLAGDSNVKSFLLALLVSVLSVNTTFAGSPTVRSSVETLASLAMGFEVQTIAGKNATEMFENFLKESYGEDPDRKLIFKEISDMAFGDEVDEGFTSTKSASGMGEFAEGFLKDKIEGLEYEAEANKEELKTLKAQIFDLQAKWQPLIKRLENQGAKFGYTGNGPGYCGVSFIELIVIDVKEHKIYQVYLSRSEDC